MFCEKKERLHRSRFLRNCFFLSSETAVCFWSWTWGRGALSPLFSPITDWSTPVSENHSRCLCIFHRAPSELFRCNTPKKNMKDVSTRKKSKAAYTSWASCIAYSCRRAMSEKNSGLFHCDLFVNLDSVKIVGLFDSFVTSCPLLCVIFKLR